MNEIDGGVGALHTPEDPSHHKHIRTALATGVGAAIAAGRGYKLVRSTSQVVAGSLHSYYIRFDGDGDKDQYKITAWSRPWLKEPTEALQITFVGKE
ncbi:cystatin-like protein [Culex quinquefasciatus]|uniref:Cystatin-like protein n=1 Tax=Culex quinquefasciatus TaxID=7176 RepID=B0W6L9_CULQU|nr:cystatin-like protein [Culex quinquefasciatus]|eukprot:XP_001844353.1 cystatin-like protein [Culex quinquefasciatus]